METTPLASRDLNVAEVDTPVSEKNVLKSRLRPRPAKRAEEVVVLDNDEDDDDDDDEEFEYEIEENIIDQVLNDPPSPWTRGDGSVTPLGEKDAEQALNESLSVILPPLDAIDLDQHEDSNVSTVQLDEEVVVPEKEEALRAPLEQDDQEEDEEDYNQVHLVDQLAPASAPPALSQRTKEGGFFSFCGALFNCN